MVHEAVAQSLTSLRSWPMSLPWAQHEPSVDASEAYCLRSAEEFAARKSFVFLAFHHEGEFIGSIGLHDIDWARRKMEIGFWLRSSVHRQGYAKEAVGGVMNVAFERLNARRVEARTDEGNHACRATCLSVGMQLEGILHRNHVTAAASLRSTCIYAAVR